MARTEKGTFLLGAYPQSAVQDVSVTAKLRMIADVQNAWQIEGKRIIFADVTSEGKRYRGIFRPELQKTSWFRYEPIEWDILEENDRTMLLLSSHILDAQRFNREIQKEEIRDDGCYFFRGTEPVAARNYHSPVEKGRDLANLFLFSDLKLWLEHDFLNAAFEIDEGAQILTEVRKDHACYDMQKHNHRVFLLSERELYSPKYRAAALGVNRHATEYAEAVGCRDDCWWTETGYDDYSIEAYCGILVRTVQRMLKENATVSLEANMLSGVVPAIRVAKD